VFSDRAWRTMLPPHSEPPVVTYFNTWEKSNNKTNRPDTTLDYSSPKLISVNGEYGEFVLLVGTVLGNTTR